MGGSGWFRTHQVYVLVDQGHNPGPRTGGMDHLDLGEQNGPGPTRTMISFLLMNPALHPGDTP